MQEVLVGTRREPRFKDWAGPQQPERTTTSTSTSPVEGTVLNNMFPPCTKFSNLQNLNKAINGPEWHEKFEVELEQAKEHVRFCVGLMREQLAAGRHFLFEYQAWASSWDLP